MRKATDIAKRRSRLSPVKLALLEKRLKGGFKALLKSSAIEKRPDQTAFPLSFAQERFWFLDQLEPGSPVYNRPMGLRLKGALNVSALERALNAILGRHDVLRANFSAKKGRPIQSIAPTMSLSLDVVDLSALDAADRENESLRLSAEEALRPFELARDPLLRAMLFRLAMEDHILLLVMHHIVCDGWSARVFTKELAVLYEAFSTGTTSPLPELPIQYADHAYWQRQRFQGEVFDQQVSYWRDILADSPPVLDLPTDRPRQSHQTFCGANQTIRISSSLLNLLKALSRKEDVTLFMTLLAAFKVLLYRYTGQMDIVVGSPIAGRTHIETEDLIGFFVNTLVLRTDLSGNPSFRQLLQRIREITIGAYEHGDLPFEKLVEVVKPVRELSRTPVFQVLYNFENVPEKNINLPELSISEFEFGSGMAAFDLSVEILEKKEELYCLVNYNTDIFESLTITRMAGHYQTLLESIVTNPDQRISELSLLTEAERHQILVDWNATQQNYASEKTLAHLFEEQVERSPDAIAVVYEDQNLTYKQLNKRANQLACHLSSLGVGPETNVGLCVERSFEMVVGLLGTLKTGGTYVPLDPGYPQERLAFMLENTQAPVLLTREKFLEDLPAYAGHVVCLDKDFEAIAGASEKNPISAITPDSAAYVIYTSGSTGTPKGVIGLHRGVVNRLSWMWRVYPFKGGEVCCQKTHLNFVDSVWEIFGPLLKGVPAVIIPEEVVKDPHLLVDNLAAARVSRIVLVPSLLRVVLDSFGDLQKRLSDLKIWVTSGEEISVELAQRFRQVMPEAKLFNLYGSSEVSADVTCYEVADGMPDRCIPIGRPIDNTAIYILDSHLQPVPIGVPGELYIGGVGLARGYLNQPELTAERFIPSPFGQEEVLFKTGDLGRYHPDGNIEYLGRIDHQVKVRGFRIELGEVESQIKGLEAVSNCAVVLREDQPADQRLTAYYVCKDGQAVSESDVRQRLQAQLPEYMLPQHLVELSSIPLTPSGKMDRSALPAPDIVRPDLHEAFVAPRSQSEELVAGIWAKVLGVARVGIRDDFFDLGGHSLLAVRLVADMEQRLGMKVPLTSVFQGRNIQAILGLLENREKGDRPAACIPLRERGSRPPFFAGGSNPRYQAVADCLSSDQPFYRLDVYKLQSEHIARGLKPLRRIEDIAAVFVEDIRTIQPAGPYSLGGGCEGGVVAFEVARQLQHLGEEVATLFIWVMPAPQVFRTPPLHRAFMRLVWQIRALFKKSSGMRLELRDIVPFARHEYIEYLIFRTVSTYRPDSPYQGKLTIARHYLPGYPELEEASMGWAELATDGADVHSLPGRHEDWLDFHAREFAQLLGDVLNFD